MALYEIICGDKELIDSIEEHWIKLICYHREKSSHSQSDFRRKVSKKTDH